MPHVFTALSTIAGFVYYHNRSRTAARFATNFVAAAADAPKAVRRFRFRGKANAHPVESIEDPAIAIAGIATAFVAQGQPSTADWQDRLAAEIRHTFDLTAAETEELLVLARWLVNQCGTSDAAINRMSRKLYRLSGPAAVAPLMTIVRNTLAANGALDDRQRDALHDVSRALGVR